MDLSPIGEAVLIAREGRRLKAYRDSKGIWTIGVGHTSAAGAPTVRAGLGLTEAECDALFGRDVERFVRCVREALPPDASLSQHAFDALVSLCFNIGPGAFLRSGVLRRLHAGDPAGAAEAILQWRRPAEIVPRRQAEYDQFRTPYDTALPRARRGDAGPIRHPAAAPMAARPGTERRPMPVRPTVPAPVPAAGRPPAGRLAGLWTRLRARLRG